MKKRERRYTIRMKGNSLLQADSEWFYTTNSLNVAKDKFIKALFINDTYVPIYDREIEQFIMWNNSSTSNDQPYGVVYFDIETSQWVKEKLY